MFGRPVQPPARLETEDRHLPDDLAAALKRIHDTRRTIGVAPGAVKRLRDMDAIEIADDGGAFVTQQGRRLLPRGARCR